ncbi:MAG: asparagine synthase (glutamine-hydrolyzing), partial [Gaiellaceae bacterium]
RRLSIVDLSGGAQHMSNESGTVWVSYNGEIYNHVELRQELEKRHHRFRTSADTEVLVHGWEEWGERLFGKLNGIFAFALVDARRREVVLARDPLGVKPLYVGNSTGVTWWTSELQAALGSGFLKATISRDALKLFLTFRFIPSPQTIFQRVSKVPPGHFVRFEYDKAGSALVFKPYRCLIRSEAEPRTREEWRNAVLTELEAAVERQLMADVPVGSLLSGGVDSSLVTLMMAGRLPHAPDTFGIGFASDGIASEARVAEDAARELQVPHRSIDVADDAYVEAWPRALGELGEPIANSGALLVRLLCEEVGRTHKVVLSGQGADELLGGYSRHVIERLYPYGRLTSALASRVVRRVVGSEESERLSQALRTVDRIERYARILSVLPWAVVDAAVLGGTPAADLAREAVARWVRPDQVSDPVNELLRVDTRMSLADDLLIIADHFSMRSSVELRVPFLDLRLSELLERMPSCYKVSRLGRRKALYREGAASRLPPALAEKFSKPSHLQRKRGFSTPLDKWFTLAGGLLAEPEEWRAPLESIGIASSGVRGLLGTPSEVRRRTVVYTLATWILRHSEIEGAEAP